jgi:P27 family predicted phage terminase small subunit
MAAPTPKPTALKKLQGTYRPDRAARDEMQPSQLDTLPAAPDELNARGQQAWYTAATELQQLGMLHAVDLPLLQAYCREVQRMHEADYYVRTQGTVLKGKNKVGSEYYLKNPWLGIYNDALAQANRLAQQFGFTPSARTRISAPAKEKPKADPWAEL